MNIKGDLKLECSTKIVDFVTMLLNNGYSVNLIPLPVQDYKSEIRLVITKDKESED